MGRERLRARRDRRQVDIPVQVVPVPVQPPPGPFRTRLELDLPDRFTFLFVFDFWSWERKNPAAVVEAFAKAFEPGEGPVLVLKSVHGLDWKPLQLARVEALADGREDILTRDGYVSAHERDSYMRRATATSRSIQRGPRPHDGRGDRVREAGRRDGVLGES